MNFELTEDEEMLKAVVERFVADMPEIGRRAGAAMRSTAFVVLIFAADPSSARELETLTRTLGE